MSNFDLSLTFQFKKTKQKPDRQGGL